jgi:protein involved in polysaccharide export with SLBB domain
MIGAVKVQGLSTKQVEQTIEKNLKEKGWNRPPAGVWQPGDFGAGRSDGTRSVSGSERPQTV